jgi:hypothetical protein
VVRVSGFSRTEERRSNEHDDPKQRQGPECDDQDHRSVKQHVTLPWTRLISDADTGITAGSLPHRPCDQAMPVQAAVETLNFGGLSMLRVN